MTEREALISLNLIPDIGSVRLKNLRETFGSAPKIFLNSKDSLKRVDKIGDKIASAIAGFSFESLKKELELAEKLKIQVITLRDKDYPENLKEIYDPPICLYVKGGLLPSDVVSLAIVGSRRASYYGLSCAQNFAYSLAGAGITIVSGLARGIDTQAHKGVLKAKGRTIAVLGSGLNRVYPAENKKLAEEIAERGAVVSEFPLNTDPLARNFPRRNRIISGLSLGTIVVEAAKNSGALITADFALEQGRDVFAVPGSVTSATSFGTNRLIKQGAKLVDSIEDIIEELRPELENLLKNKSICPMPGLKTKEQKQPLAIEAKRGGDKVLSEEENKVCNLLDSENARYADEIIENSGLPGPKVMSILLRLEVNNLIKQLPGKMFVKSEKL